MSLGGAGWVVRDSTESLIAAVAKLLKEVGRF